jgi:predicted lipid carrier protein YhbT|tara:strand:+ start:201 stop:491 length:291 start_codon:yes stop_codon:yes gene_type:complete
LNKDILKEINEVVNSLKTLKKENLNKIFLEIKYEDKVEIINLESGEITENSNISKSNLLIKMNVDTFNDLKNNKKNPEDLLFEERIKISGDIKLLQ